MKRTFLFTSRPSSALTVAGLGLVAATYGLVRLTYGLFLPDVQTSLGLGDAAAGRVASGGSLAYCVGALAGFVTGRERPRALVVAAASSAAVGTLGMAVAPSVAVFAPSAVVASAAAGLVSPALVTVVGRTVDADHRDRAQSVVNAGTGPGLVAAGVLAMLLLPHWRLAWALSGLVTVLLAVAVLRLDRGGRGPAEVRALPPTSWYRGHAVPLVGSLLLGVASASVWTYGRNLLLQAGTSEPVSTLAWIGIGVGGTAVVATAATMDRRLPHVAWAITTGAVAASCLVLSAAPHVLPLALAAFVGFGWGFVAATSALIAWAARIDAERAAAGTSMLFVALVAGQSAGAALAGQAVGPVGLRVVLAASAAVAGAAAALALVEARTPVPREPAAAGRGAPAGPAPAPVNGRREWWRFATVGP